MTALARKGWRLTPSELTAALDAVDASGPARDALAFVSGRDPETFAYAVAYAAVKGGRGDRLQGRMAQAAEEWTP